MNFFCRLFGHTWLHVTRAPEPRWNTTKEGHTLVPTSGDENVTHVLVCHRCAEERPDRSRGHDDDRPELS